MLNLYNLKQGSVLQKYKIDNFFDTKLAKLKLIENNILNIKMQSLRIYMPQYIYIFCIVAIQLICLVSYIPSYIARKVFPFWLSVCCVVVHSFAFLLISSLFWCQMVSFFVFNIRIIVYVSIQNNKITYNLYMFMQNCIIYYFF